MSNHDTEWTVARIQMLRLHHAEGLSAQESANIIGGVSRVAVIEKRRREGLAMTREARAEAFKTNKASRTVSDTRRLRVTAAPDVIAAIPVIVDHRPGTPLLSLRRFGECRWPVEDGVEPADMLFCADVTFVAPCFAAHLHSPLTIRRANSQAGLRQTGSNCCPDRCGNGRNATRSGLQHQLHVTLAALNAEPLGEHLVGVIAARQTRLPNRVECGVGELARTMRGCISKRMGAPRPKPAMQILRAVMGVGLGRRLAAFWANRRFLFAHPMSPPKSAASTMRAFTHRP